MHWTDAYIGRPYLPGALGADSYDCWGLVRAVLRDRHGIEVPPVPAVDRDDLRAIIREILGNPERAQWRRASWPRDGDVVELSHSRYPHHVGIWVDADGGGVLHALEGAGVIFSTHAALTVNRWFVCGYWRHVRLAAIHPVESAGTVTPAQAGVQEAAA